SSEPPDHRMPNRSRCLSMMNRRQPSSTFLTLSVFTAQANLTVSGWTADSSAAGDDSNSRRGNAVMKSLRSDSAGKPRSLRKLTWRLERFQTEAANKAPEVDGADARLLSHVRLHDHPATVVVDETTRRRRRRRGFRLQAVVDQSLRRPAGAHFLLQLVDLVDEQQDGHVLQVAVEPNLLERVERLQQSILRHWRVIVLFQDQVKAAHIAQVENGRHVVEALDPLAPLATLTAHVEHAVKVEILHSFKMIFQPKLTRSVTHSAVSLSQAWRISKRVPNHSPKLNRVPAVFNVEIDVGDVAGHHATTQDVLIAGRVARLVAARVLVAQLDARVAPERLHGGEELKRVVERVPVGRQAVAGLILRHQLQQPPAQALIVRRVEVQRELLHAGNNALRAFWRAGLDRILAPSTERNALLKVQTATYNRRCRKQNWKLMPKRYSQTNLFSTMSTRSIVAAAIAESSAHGIGRAVGARSIALKIMWTVLFLVFLVLCCRSSWSLIEKLINITIDQTYEAEKVPFEFPDLYLCPSLIYSGSIPYTLQENEAKIVNDEVERLNRLYDRLYCENDSKLCTGPHETLPRVSKIQMSMPVHILQKYLLQSRLQAFLIPPAVMHSSLSQSKFQTGITTFLHPNNEVCFKVNLPEEEYDNLNYRRSNVLAWPFVDPHNSDFNYGGAAINPITNPFNNESVPFEDWQTTDGYYGLSSLGYNLQVVPRGAYPSPLHETKVSLAAGRQYEISLEMEDKEFSSELHGTYCNPSQAKPEFQDQLTGAQKEYKNSRGACFFIHMSTLLENRFKVLVSQYPKPWKWKDVPMIENMTEIAMSNISSAKTSIEEKMKDFIDKHTQQVIDHCTKHQPCEYKKYTVQTTSMKWPRSSKGLARFILKFFGSYIASFKKCCPGTARLIELAKNFSSGNHSAHTESFFRHYVSQSMIQVMLSVKSPMSPKITMAYSYSWVAFLADMGGTLGLYIGCSLLTLCELLELAYHLVMARWRLGPSLATPATRILLIGRRESP
uniref:PKD_channel domain-containing protein n=1 Tax=Macrostomum lignano TaxID=282301 RepID=A0A1I8IT78_9PLAT